MIEQTEAEKIHSDRELRDWFAGQALAGQCAYDGIEGYDAVMIAIFAYEIADAMMKERAK